MEEIIANIKHNIFGQKSLIVPKIIEVSKSSGIEKVNSVEWENFCLDIRNDMLKDFKFAYSLERDKGWNQFARQYREDYSENVKKIIKELGFKGTTNTSLAFDLGNTIIYKYLNTNYNFYFQFYEEMYQIYLSGQLPVGYEGNYPNGTFYVMNPQSESSEGVSIVRIGGGK